MSYDRLRNDINPKEARMRTSNPESEQPAEAEGLEKAEHDDNLTTAADGTVAEGPADDQASDEDRPRI
jgi:hypothetical protein